MKKLLSERETEILKLLKFGYTNKVIGRSLFISDHTVKAHLESMFLKTGMKNRLALLYWGIKSGLVE